ncbi:phosphoribosylaminoimidazolesuccinocarboxamide synthase [Elizabethkingia sp. JS20170427COW]|uniref:phosphoribosylaminoimidazolesuccinocarboxamide synthase n=1 Tax=Elizabethkingia sp. JS20170427COW TaxID=2583851 RepID=UPI001110B517|nr:phosphoribosylaminoimidazolesuccinocarboxamide synthase [Elizabethkingia sp. JS20170427COW]QCX54167.1 phosphoribosylaminoimidazolesuccinocarboxamide synthase [Elizabethkingia sp. JS20170427COW]
MSNKGQMLYEGKAKQVFATDKVDEVIVHFKDDATAFNGQKKDQVRLKGELNNEITTLIFKYLNAKGIPTHFIQKLGDREQLVKKVDIIPLEVITRNYVAGSMAKRLGIEEGFQSPVTIFDICYKKDELGDPLINDHHAVCLGAATYEELAEMYQLTGKINELLKELFDKMNIILVDFKIELGKTADGKIVLADEISPDTCRLWDKDTKEKLDKDRFRRDLGGVTEAYQEITKRLKAALNK